MMQKRGRWALLAVLLLLVAGVRPLDGQRKGEWLPVTPEDLALKEVPGVSGAHAVILYRESIGDDNQSFQDNYIRIKILTEEGRKYADIDIPYVKGGTSIAGIKARTIRPDGSILEFEGKIFDKLIVKGRGVKVQAKAFTMPEVQAGSIIEYKYTMRWDIDKLRQPRWDLQDDDLFTRRARFSFKPYLEQGLSVSWVNFKVPSDQQAKDEKGAIGLEVNNVPPLEEEEYMPPEREMQMRVEFFYHRGPVEVPEKFWKREGEDWHRVVEDFIGKRGGIAKAAAEITAGASGPDDQLRRIYTRVQQVRNLNFEREKTEKEEKREKLKDNSNIEDVWKRGYGYRSQINRLFVGLARAAGFDAGVVRISERDTYFFHRNLQDAWQLDGEVAVVRVGNEDRYFDAGTPNCPFGLLSWEKTGVQGIRLNKDGGTFVTTPAPNFADALAERKGTFRLLPDGSLQGKVQYTFVGYQAIRRRRDAVGRDEQGRKEDLEEEVKNALPSGAIVKLESVSGWEGWEAPLKAEFSVEIPGYAVGAGSRMLVPTAILHSGRRHPFQHARRKHPVYFSYPWQEEDDLTVELPEGFRIESLPSAKQASLPFSQYSITREENAGKLRIKRKLVMNGFYFPQEYYSTLRQFYDRVRAGDEEQAVLRAK